MPQDSTTGNSIPIASSRDRFYRIVQQFVVDIKTFVYGENSEDENDKKLRNDVYVLEICLINTVELDLRWNPMVTLDSWVRNIERMFPSSSSTRQNISAKIDVIRAIYEIDKDFKYRFRRLVKSMTRISAIDQLHETKEFRMLLERADQISDFFDVIKEAVTFGALKIKLDSASMETNLIIPGMENNKRPLKFTDHSNFTGAETCSRRRESRDSLSLNAESPGRNIPTILLNSEPSEHASPSVKRHGHSRADRRITIWPGVNGVPPLPQSIPNIHVLSSEQRKSPGYDTRYDQYAVSELNPGLLAVPRGHRPSGTDIEPVESKNKRAQLQEDDQSSRSRNDIGKFDKARGTDPAVIERRLTAWPSVLAKESS